MISFLPDSQAVGSPDVLKLVSGVPTKRGFAPPPGVQDFSASALVAASTGGAHVMYGAGATRTLASTATKVYEYGSAAWVEVGSWVSGSSFFVGFGSNIYVFGSSVKPQKVTGSLTAFDGPKAIAGDTAGYFVMLGNTDDSSSGLSTAFGAQTGRWWCSAYADGEDWEPDASTQCASGLLTDTAGDITAVRAMGDRFVFYKQGAIYLATYTGPPDVFSFQRISDRVGALGQPCVVKVDTVQYFIGAENIWRFDGTQVVPIGDGVREWFFASLDRPYGYLIQGRHDPYNELIYWHYPTSGGSGALTKVLVYHIPSGRFGAFDFTVTRAFATEGGALWVNPGGGITAKQMSMAYLDGSRLMKSLSAAGTALSCTTAWFGDEEAVTLCDRVKPRFGNTAPSAGTLDADTCMTVGGSVTDIAQSTMSGARFDILARGRYHRQALAFTGSGFEIEAIGPRLKPGGRE